MLTFALCVCDQLGLEICLPFKFCASGVLYNPHMYQRTHEACSSVPQSQQSTIAATDASSNTDTVQPDTAARFTPWTVQHTHPELYLEIYRQPKTVVTLFASCDLTDDL